MLKWLHRHEEEETLYIRDPRFRITERLELIRILSENHIFTNSVEDFLEALNKLSTYLSEPLEDNVKDGF